LKRKDVLFLLLLTFFALLVHGYHPGAEDSETYLPGIEKVLHPKLFPVGTEYFQLHAHLTLFPQVMADSVRISHLPFAWVLFLWQIMSIFLFLLACRVLASMLFRDARAIWGGVALVTALLTLPVAGTALYIMDQYINPRNMTAFAVVFAVVYVLQKKFWRAALFLLFAVAIHPFMTCFAISYCVLLGWMGRSKSTTASRAAAAPDKAGAPAVASVCLLLPLSLSSTPKGYDAVAVSHAYQYLLQWRWYGILGAVAPLAILWGFRSLARKNKLTNLELVCSSLIVYGAIYLFFGVLFSSAAVFESIARLQPMRSFYLLYILFILIGGGFVAQYILKNRPLRWLALFLPLCAGMYTAQRALFPDSAHVEWPGAAPKNPWVQAFQWARQNTPENAIFAINPHYMDLKGEDSNGFRAIAERSQLADAVKDAGVVEMFPEIADNWQRQVRAQTGLHNFSPADFHDLKMEYGVTWVVLQQPTSRLLDCSYSNPAVRICRVP
jgi:hypothetical protein